MSFKNIDDILLFGSNTLGDVVGDGAGFIYVSVSGGAQLHKFDLVTGQFVRTVSTTINSNPAGLCLVNSASAFQGTGAATYQLIQLSSGFVHTTSSFTTNSARGRQNVIAENGAGIVIASADTTSDRVVKYDSTTFTGSNLTVTGTTPGAGSCSVIRKPGTSNFLVGWRNGKITEINTSGAIQKTITLPTTPNVGTAPDQQVMFMSMADDTLICSTDNGIMYVIAYAAGTITQRIMVTGSSNGPTNGGFAISPIINGFFITSNNLVNSMNNGAVTFWSLTSRGAVQEAVYSFSSNAVVGNVGWDTSVNRVWIAGGSKIKILEMPVYSTTTVETRIQDPPGTDVDGRIIRIRDYNKGKSAVTLSSTLTAGATAVDARTEGNYLEIVLRGSGATRKWDWRRFNK